MLRTIFYRLTPVKNKAIITGGNFEKLAANSVFAKVGLKKVDLSLSF
jgi:type II secretory pathway component PulC